ncbi:MAG: mechanosensitive ion channel family protein, partial [Actinomycetota bacterium]
MLFAYTLGQAAPDSPCGAQARVCDSVYGLTGSETIARASELVVTPIKIALIVALAWLATRLLSRAIKRLTRGLRSASADMGTGRGAGTLLRTGPAVTARATQRAETIGQLMTSVATFAVWSIAALMVFAELGLELGPLLAGAGIVGIALGFGAQNLVRDFLSGIFM